MKTESIIELGNEAIKQGFATMWTENDLVCNSECDDCPSVEACEYLAGYEKSFNTWVTNYKRMVVPELRKLNLIEEE